MSHVIEKKSAVPIHVQLRKIILDMVTDGDVKPGDRLYSEAELCRKFDISRMTVRKVIDDLAKEGYLYRVAGKGTFVAKPKIVEKLAYLVTFTEDMLNRGMCPGCRVLERKAESPPPKIAEYLDLHKEERVIRVKRLLLADEEPICLQEAYLPWRLFRGFMKVSEEEILHRDMCDILNTFIIHPVAWARQTLEAVTLQKEEAGFLRVPSNAPGLLCERITYDEAERPIEYITFLYRSDRYKFMVGLITPNHRSRSF